MFNTELVCVRCMKGTVRGNRCTSCGAPRMEKQELETVLPLYTILNGRYLVGRMLGAGGFGVTYIGYDLGQERRIAVKEFMPSGMVSRRPGECQMQVVAGAQDYAASMERFLEEARMIYRYQKNPHILQVHSLFRENGTAYYVMEYLEGSDLKHILRQRGGRMTWQELMPVAMQVIDALAVLHKDGVVHRDISPDNIFVAPDGRTTLIDFGAARLYMAQKQLTVILKRKYAPLEQYESRGRQGPWTDIYALAATLYHCLTGKLPQEATERVYRDTMQTVRECGAVVDAHVEQAIAHAMRTNPQDRYQNVMDFRNDLLGRRRQLRLVGVSGVYRGADIAVTDSLMLGRNAVCCQLVYPNEVPGISGRHCVLRPAQDGTVLEICDVGSTYGTFVNGARLNHNFFYRLKSGDVIHMGVDQEWRIE